ATGEALVRGTQQQGGELVADCEHQLEIGDDLIRSFTFSRSNPGLRRASTGQQLREGEAAEILRQANVQGRGLVQLGQRGGHVLACADLEEAGKRLCRG